MREVQAIVVGPAMTRVVILVSLDALNKFIVMGCRLGF